MWLTNKGFAEKHLIRYMQLCGKHISHVLKLNLCAFFHARGGAINVIFICIIFMECLRYFKYMVWQNKEESWAKATSSMHCVLVLWLYLFINF